MKKRFLLFAVLLLMALAVQLGAQEDIEFVDSFLKHELLTHAPAIDTDSDGEISLLEAQAYGQTIILSDNAISAFDDIKYFENITGLKCSSAGVKHVDLTPNKQLVSLDVSFSGVETLVVGSSSKLESIDVSMTNLEKIVCTGSDSLKAVDLSNQPNLKHVNLSNNPNLSFIDLSNSFVRSSSELSFNISQTSVSCIVIDDVQWGNTVLQLLDNSKEYVFSSACPIDFTFYLSHINPDTGVRMELYSIYLDEKNDAGYYKDQIVVNATNGMHQVALLSVSAYEPFFANVYFDPYKPYKTVALSYQDAAVSYGAEIIGECIPYDYYGQHITESGIYSRNMADGTVEKTFISVSEKYVDTIYKTIPQGDAYEFDGKKYTQSIVETAHFPSFLYCDSVVTLSLTVEGTPVVHYFDKEVCDVFEYKGKMYDETQTIYDTLKTLAGNDSIVVINLTVHKSPQPTIISDTIADGDVNSFNGINYYETGEYTYKTEASNGCDSIVVLRLFVKGQMHRVVTDTVCDYYTDKNNPLIIFDKTDRYNYAYFDDWGGEVSVDLDLTVFYSSQTVLYKTISAQESYSFFDKNLTENGRYTYVMQTVQGCDSIIVLNLATKNEQGVYFSYADAVCNNVDTFKFGNQVIEEKIPGNYTYRNTYNVNGTDSIVTLRLTVNPSYFPIVHEYINVGESYILGNTVFTKPVTRYFYPLTSAKGCDSIVEFRMDVLTQNDTLITLSGCENVIIDGRKYIESGHYNYKTKTSNGLSDSVVYMDIAVYKAPRRSVSASIYDGETFMYGSRSFETEGDYEIIVANENELCDSIIYLHLDVLQKTEKDIRVKACGSYSLGNSVIFESSEFTKSYPEAELNPANIDSIEHYYITILPVDKATEKAVIYEGGAYAFQGNLYSLAGTYEVVYENRYGCDSILELDLTVYPNYVKYEKKSFCDSVRFNDRLITSSGLYYDTIDYPGQDTVYVRNLTINYTHYDTIDTTIIKGQEFKLAGATLSQSGFYSVIVEENAYGVCNSVAIVNLTVDENSALVRKIDTTVCDQFTYGDTTLYTSKTHLVDDIDGQGFVEVSLVVNTSDETRFMIHKLAGATHVFNGVEYSRSTVESFKTTNVHGCDSVVTMELKIGDPYYKILDTVACNTFEFNGREYTQSIKDPIVYRTIYGVDSTVALNLTLGKDYTSIGFRSLIDGDSVETVKGSYVYQARETPYEYRFETVLGCDSIFKYYVRKAEVSRDTVSQCGGYNYNGEIILRDTVIKTIIQNVEPDIPDRIHFLHVTVYPLYDQLYIIDTIFRGDSVLFGGEYLSETGQYEKKSVTINGCDSIVVLDLRVVKKQSVSLIDSIVCDKFEYQGQWYFESTIIADTIDTDTELIIEGYDFTVGKSYSDIYIKKIIEEGKSFAVGNNVIYSDLKIENKFHTELGCDSVVYYDLTFVPNADNIERVAVTKCGVYTLHNGAEVAKSGEYLDVYDENGELKQQIKNISILPEYSDVQQQTIQYLDSAQFFGMYYYQQGLYTHFEKTILGCDSVFILDLKVANNAPVFASDLRTNFNVIEKPAVDSYYIGNFLAADPDANAVTYWLLDDFNAFEIDENADLTVYDPSFLDYDQRAVIPITIIASDGLNEAMLEIKIALINKVGVDPGSEISVYPTIVTNVLNIDGISSETKLTVVNSDGKTVLDTRITSSIMVDFKKLPKGVYSVLVYNQSLFRSFMFVKL